MTAPLRLVGAFDPQGRAALLDRAWARLSDICGWTGPELDPQEPAFRALRLGIRGPVGAGRPLRRPGGLVAAGFARLYDPVSAGPDPEGEDLDRLALAWREGAFDRLSAGCAAVEGDYAVAIFDPSGPTLTLLRDPFGHEPLVHSRTPEGLVLFSTWPHALRPSAPDPEALACWFDRRALPPGRTVWPGLHEVPAAHAVRFDAGSARTIRHWHPAPDPAAVGRSDAETEALVFDRARAAVLSRLRRIGRTPAIMFSGGLDSSLIAGIACDAEPDVEVPAYASASAEGAAPTERRAREAMAARWPNLRLRDVSPEGLGLLDHSDAAWERFAQPNLDYFAATYHALPQAMLRDGRDTALGGFGGDMCVSNPLESLLFHRLSRLDARGAAREARSLRGLGASGRVLAALILRPLRQTAGLPAQRHPPLLRLGPPRPAPPGVPSPDTRLTGPLAEQLGALETVATWNIADFHFGPEAVGYSQPLLDTRLIAATLAAPLRLQRLDGLPRGLMRRMLLRVAPPEVAMRRDKSPFQPDFDPMVRAALPRIRKDLMAFRDLPLWRELVDEPLLEDRLSRLDRTPALRDLPALNGVTSAWFLGDFLRRL